MLYRDWRANTKAIDDARAVLNDNDPEMSALAKDELESLTKLRDEIEAKLKRALVPKDPRDDRDVIVEIRAGTGGDEAALFAADLYRMYTRYADRRGWKVELDSAERDRHRRVQGDHLRDPRHGRILAV